MYLMALIVLCGEPPAGSSQVAKGLSPSTLNAVALLLGRNRCTT